MRREAAASITRLRAEVAEAEQRERAAVDTLYDIYSRWALQGMAPSLESRVQALLGPERTAQAIAALGSGAGEGAQR